MDCWIGLIVVIGIVAWAIWAIADDKKSARGQFHGFRRRNRCRG